MNNLGSATLEDLRTCGYEEHIRPGESNITNSSALFKGATEAREKGKEQAAVALQLLSVACSLELNPENQREPFKPFAIFNGVRSAILADFTKEDGMLFAQFVPHIADLELAARIADLAWLTKNDFKSANIAIDCYIKLSSTPCNLKRWFKRIDYLERAFRLAISIKNDQAINEIRGILIEHIDQEKEYFHFLAAKRSLCILLELKQEDNAFIAERALILAEKIGDHHDLQYSFVEIADRAFISGKMDNRAQEARLVGAEILLKKTREARKLGNMIASAYYFQQAISVFQNCKGSQERIKSLQPEFEETIKAAYLQMKKIPISTDVSEFVKRAKNAMQDKPLDQALLSFAYLIGTIPREKLKENVLEQAKQLAFQYTVFKSVYNGDGRLVALIPPLLSSKGKDYGCALDAACFEHAAIHHAIFVSGTILPARDEILRLHQIDKKILLSTLQHCAFIPQDRLTLWVKGILAGFDNDFDVALHLLIPQFEHALRKMLEVKGEIVWRIDRQTQFHTERSLNELLCMDATKKFFGEDLQFELQGLLTERTGQNIRNECSHGLMSEQNFYSPSTIYLWWRLFHIVLHLSLTLTRLVLDDTHV